LIARSTFGSAPEAIAVGQVIDLALDPHERHRHRIAVALQTCLRRFHLGDRYVQHLLDHLRVEQLLFERVQHRFVDGFHRVFDIVFTHASAAQVIAAARVEVLAATTMGP
jgi:hypothetical protein